MRVAGKDGNSPACHPPRPVANLPVPWWRAYLLLMGAAVRAQLQYRSNLLLTFAGGAAFQSVGLVFVWLVVERFGAIDGWSMAEVAFLYGMRLVSHGLWLVPCSQVYRIDAALRTGVFDRYLIRPGGPLVQLLTQRFQLEHVGDLVTGVVVLGAAASRLHMGWSFLGVVYLLLAVAGGAMIEGALQLAIASLSFRALSTQSLRMLIDSVFNNFGGYPMRIFPTATQFALTFLVPLAFVAYLPAGVLLGHSAGLHVSPWLAFGAPVVGPVLLLLAHRLWRSQIKHYSSSGH